MENLNLNLPPFYIGQKVVAIHEHSRSLYRKGQEYTVRSVSKGCAHFPWLISVFEINEPTQCKECSTIFYKDTLDANNFAPIEEKFISYADVIAKEAPVTCLN